MRILHVVRQFTPSVGGLESVVLRLAAEQRHRLGHDVRVVTLDRLFARPSVKLPADEVIQGVRVVRLPWTGSLRYPLCPQVIAHLGDADVVHVHAIDFFFDWLSATRWFHRKPLIASTHGGFFHTAYASTLKRLWFATITRWSAGGYRRIVASSDNDGVLFAPIAGARLTVIENGAEIDRYRDVASRERVPVVLFFGRWSANKGLPELIELLAALRARDPRWTLIIAGRPSDLSASDLREAIAARSLGDAVEIHESPSDDALRLLMARASYFGCLSRHEGFGIAAIEAMSAGLVPLLGDIPPFRKIVEQARTGLLIPANESAVDAAVRVGRVHDDGMTGASVERERAVAFTRRYEWPAVADRFQAVYDDVLRDAHRRLDPAATP